MKAWVLVLVCGVGGTAALLWAFGADPAVPDPLRSPADDQRGAARPGDVAGRLERLEDEVDALKRELAAMRVGTSVRSRLSSGQGSEPGDATGPIRDEVLEIVGEERERERERRFELRRERWAELTQEILADLTVKAQLSTEHAETISGLWTSEAERMMPLFAAARGGERSFSEIGQEMQAIHDETDEAVRELLSDEQFAMYFELRPRGPQRGSGRRPR